MGLVISSNTWHISHRAESSGRVAFKTACVISQRLGGFKGIANEPVLLRLRMNFPGCHMF